MKSFNFCIIIDDDPLNNLISENVIYKHKIAMNVKSLISVDESINFFNNLNRAIEFPDLIFLDIQFPHEKDGWYFLDYFSEFFASKVQTHLYLLTSSISKRDIERATSYQYVAGFLSKPLSKEKVMNLWI